MGIGWQNRKRLEKKLRKRGKGKKRKK